MVEERLRLLSKSGKTVDMGKFVDLLEQIGDDLAVLEEQGSCYCKVGMWSESIFDFVAKWKIHFTHNELKNERIRKRKVENERQRLEKQD